VSATSEAIDVEPAVSLGELGDSLGFLLRMAQVRSYERFFARFGHLDLRPGEFAVMWVIRLNPGIKQGIVARTLRIKPAQMTKVIRRLERQGILTRTIPEDDRRSVVLSLTAQGQAFVQSQVPAFFGSNDYHEHSLTPDEVRELARLLRKYAEIERGS